MQLTLTRCPLCLTTTQDFTYCATCRCYLIIRPGLPFAQHSVNIVALQPVLNVIEAKLQTKSDAILHYLLALIAMNLEYYSEAITELHAALALKPDLFQLHYSLAAALFISGSNLEEARTAIRGAIQLQPDYYPALQLLELIEEKSLRTPLTTPAATLPDVPALAVPPLEPVQPEPAASPGFFQISEPAPPSPGSTNPYFTSQFEAGGGGLAAITHALPFAVDPATVSNDPFAKLAAPALGSTPNSFDDLFAAALEGQKPEPMSWRSPINNQDASPASAKVGDQADPSDFGANLRNESPAFGTSSTTDPVSNVAYQPNASSDYSNVSMTREDLEGNSLSSFSPEPFYPALFTEASPQRDDFAAAPFNPIPFTEISPHKNDFAAAPFDPAPFMGSSNTQEVDFSPTPFDPALLAEGSPQKEDYAPSPFDPAPVTESTNSWKNDFAPSPFDPAVLTSPVSTTPAIPPTLSGFSPPQQVDSRARQPLAGSSHTAGLRFDPQPFLSPPERSKFRPVIPLPPTMRRVLIAPEQPQEYSSSTQSPGQSFQASELPANPKQAGFTFPALNLPRLTRKKRPAASSHQKDTAPLPVTKAGGIRAGMSLRAKLLGAAILLVLVLLGFYLIKGLLIPSTPVTQSTRLGLAASRTSLEKLTTTPGTEYKLLRSRTLLLPGTKRHILELKISIDKQAQPKQIAGALMKAFLDNKGYGQEAVQVYGYRPADYSGGLPTHGRLEYFAPGTPSHPGDLRNITKHRFTLFVGSANEFDKDHKQDTITY